MYRITVHNSLQDIDESEWDSIVPLENAFHGHRAQLFFEQEGLVNWPPRYFCFRNEQGELVAHATAYLIPTSLVIFSSGIVRSVVDWIRTFWPAFLQPTMLECGCPISPGNPVCVRGDVDRKLLLKALAKAADMEASKTNVKFVVIRDFEDNDLPFTQGITESGYIQIANLPTTLLQIRWGNFEAYLKDLRTKYRAKVRRGMTIALRAGLTTKVRDVFAESAEDLVREWQNVHDHADEYAREELTTEFYAGIGQGLDGRCRLIEVLQDGQRVAHALAVIDGRLLRWLFFGRKKPMDRDGAYFLVISAVVRLAIEEQLATVEMGLTTYSPKTDFGAEMIPLWVFVRFRGTILGKALPLFVKFFNPVPQIRQRKVFRSTHSS
ncbi:GNAT family N-acetyltransferase [Oxalobacteraceae bacterium OTU3REALA1]|nr:GNAT family N-acetyltransferase [Oxalobacteraceae bacterium OTU3REALA1]